MASAARKLSGDERDVRVAIDRSTGEYETFRRWEVIEDDEEISFFIRLEDVEKAKLKAHNQPPWGFQSRIKHKTIYRSGHFKTC